LQLEEEVRAVIENEELLRVMYLSGTVSIPPRLPDVADISFAKLGTEKMVVATQRISPKLIIKRSFSRYDVKSIFVPIDSERPDLDKGEWFEGDKLDDKINKEQGGKGIIYVLENAQSILELQAGLTAAESAEYYPPLPDDRSVNHYNMDADGAGKKAGCYLG
jgi:hypothetical protein